MRTVPEAEVQGQGVGRLVSPEASVPGLQLTALSLCPNMVFPLQVYVPGLCRVQISSSSKDILRRLDLMASF